jgi:hypothetical protein
MDLLGGKVRPSRKAGSEVAYAPAVLYPLNIYGTHFCWRLSSPLGHITAGRIRSIEKWNYLIRNQTFRFVA